MTFTVTQISIHAPRTGSDDNWLRGNALKGDFNPRSPHGERRCLYCKVPAKWLFQSTLPARGATIACSAFASSLLFQSTLPARGATMPVSSPASLASHFNPRSPHGERPAASPAISIDIWNFNPRSPHGERLSSAAGTGKGNTFQSTLPARGATAAKCHRKM